MATDTLTQRTTATPADRANGLMIALYAVQGVYYLLTGLWPLVSIDTFQMVTGPKTDLWLVQTVGALIIVIAVALLTAAWRGNRHIETIILAIGSIVALAAVDVVFVSLGVIAPIYLADAVAEGVLLIGWLAALSR